MGCGLRKLEEPEDSSPGKIYSTLRRPQVETKTDTVYEYVLLDFSLEGTSGFLGFMIRESFLTPSVLDTYLYQPQIPKLGAMV